MIRLERNGEVAILRMDDGKANAMNPRFFSDLEKGMADARDAGALVLIGARSFFSGGLDLPFLAPLERARIEEIYEALHGSMMRLFSFPAPVVAAINGHAIAGGCVLAFQSDARVMAQGSFKIGLNETQLGLALPAFVVETFRGRLAPGVFERTILEGPLYSPDLALTAGLVDEVAAAPELEGRAVERARQLASIPREAFAESKRLIRAAAVERSERARREDSRQWIDLWFSPAAQRRIGELVAKLKG